MMIDQQVSKAIQIVKTCNQKMINLMTLTDLKFINKCSIFLKHGTFIMQSRKLRMFFFPCLFVLAVHRSDSFQTLPNL